MEVKLVVTQGRPEGKEIPLPSTVFVIGRDRQCHLRPHCELVSPMHCAIARQGGRVVVRDLHSTNGTFINGEPIHGQAVVQDGDTLRIGTLAFTFRIAIDPNDPTPVQIVNEGDVDWLLQTPSDSSLVRLRQPTRLLDPHPQGGNGSQPPHGRSVSAGQYLKDYLKRPKV